MVSKFLTHVLLIALGTALAFFSLAAILAFTDPATTGYLTHGVLYISIFLTALGLFMILGLTVRHWFIKTLYAVNASHSFRQAVLIALFVTSSLYLKAHDLFAWWVEVTLILLMLAIELFLNVK